MSPYIHYLILRWSGILFLCFTGVAALGGALAAFEVMQNRKARKNRRPIY